MQSSPTAKYPASALAVLVSVFFFWGFVAASNTVLIPVFKAKFHLLQWQSQLVEFAFYIAYTIGAIIYFLWSTLAGDPLNKIGYKKGLIIGLCMSAAGTLMFVPAANTASFPLFLLGYFMIAFGFSLQQIVANPYVIALGSPATGAHRVSLAGGINSFGTTIGPLLVAYAIFNEVQVGENLNFDLAVVKAPYLILGGAFLVFAGIIWISKLPAVKNPESTVGGTWDVFRYPQLVLGMLAIFVYVGVEVTVQSNLPALMQEKEFLGMSSRQTVHFISLYWGCLMMGRWAGAMSALGLKKNTAMIMNAVMPILAFGVVIGVNYLKNSPIEDLWKFWPFVILAIVSFLIANEKPAFTMKLFGLMAAGMMLAGLNMQGQWAIYCFISAGLFCSVMWPCIFALSIAGLGKYTNQGSALLIMMIAGGAIIPPLQGWIADTQGIHVSYWVPFICFLYLALFGYLVKGILRKQGIDFDAKN